MTQLLSEARERKLSVLQRGQLWLHPVMCRMCAGRAKVFGLIHDMARRPVEGNHDARRWSDSRTLQIEQALQRLTAD